MSFSTLWGDPDVRALFEPGGPIHERAEAATSALCRLDGPTDLDVIGRHRGEISAFAFLKNYLIEASRKKQTPEVAKAASGASLPPQALRRIR